MAASLAAALLPTGPPPVPDPPGVPVDEAPLDGAPLDGAPLDGAPLDPMLTCDEPLVASRSEGAIARDVAAALGLPPRGRDDGGAVAGQEPLF